METSNQVIASDELEGGAPSHRLSWFATLQGLLFLTFILLDKTQNTMATSLLICVGIGMCVPAIAAVYTSAAIRHRLKSLLAILWVIAGVAQYAFHSI